MCSECAGTSLSLNTFVLMFEHEYLMCVILIYIVEQRDSAQSVCHTVEERVTQWKRECLLYILYCSFVGVLPGTMMLPWKAAGTEKTMQWVH